MIIDDLSVYSDDHRCASLSLQDMLSGGIHIADFTIQLNGAVLRINDIGLQIETIRYFRAAFHPEGFGTIRTINHAAAGDFIDQCSSGQRSFCTVTQMNCNTVIPLPHCTLVCGNSADGTADLDHTTVCVDCAAIDILNR